MNSSKGQIAVEYLIIIGTVLFAVIFFFYYAYSEVNKNIQMNKASDVVNKVAEIADMVYALGPGSQDYIRIDMPGSVESSSISGKEISLKIKSSTGTYDIFAETRANVTGSLPTTSGISYVSIKTLESGIVEISQ